ncbi:hypothetical protein ASG52_04050 [Methylobacterium sp. Leaf456]|uniref:hypothetical protein n=1 Tax=Methylobacterium sp. Leaf456 TaxID=1736382 RepID=UPI0006FD9B92|nr:hypothetical protein [Methylobacterium sp. Leaf456]KQT57239.1 hypothetical protein ASG52_04050 [Methylobacterium sp. Leaf456]
MPPDSPHDASGGENLPLHALLGRFESIGDNCEFGLVQRYAGIEPLGLMRFSASRIDQLLHALDSDFALYGRGDDLFVYPHVTGYLFCRSGRYDFEYNTGHLAGSDDLAAVLKREARKVGYLKRRLLEDLQLGEKIFLRKAGPEEGPAEATALLRALRRHGPSELLVVRAAEGAATVCRHEGGWWEGTVARFAPYDLAAAVHLPPWLDLCRRAWTLIHGLPDLAPPPPRNLLPPLSGRLRRHRPEPGEDQTVFGPLIDLEPRDRKAVHALTCWVWIPRSYRGEGIAAAIGDRRIRWREADLSLRDRWQKVHVTATLPDEHRKLRVGLVSRGRDAGFFRSAGWFLAESPEPNESERPPIAARLLTRG